MAESDDVEDITEGTYVYWMSQNDDIPRGALGVVYAKDGPMVKAKFTGGKIKVHPAKLNVCDFQKGTFVHSTRDEVPADVIGQVKDWEDGQLSVEIQGETVSEKPKNLIRCDFQPGMFVYWAKSDEDVSSDHMGEVIEELNEKGRVKVKFPAGCWRFRPGELIRAHVQKGSYVQWRKDDEDIAKGELGVVTGDLNDKGRLKVTFANGTWRFRPAELFHTELQKGAFVAWCKHDEDVAKGDLGRVIGVKVSKGRLQVAFPKGCWNFKANELRPHGLQPGTWVLWKKQDEDIPENDIGEVVRTSGDENRLYVQWPQGCWNMQPRELEQLPFQRGDRVHWTKTDDDIAEGHIGQVMSVKYKEVDGVTEGNKIYVKFPNGRWAFNPRQLIGINLDTEGVNELKSTFKRFDQNGDGKLSEEELLAVLGEVGVPEEEGKQLFEALDKDGDGKLSPAEFIDYIFGADASGSQKKLLGDGFGLDAVLGFGDEEEEDSDDDDPANPSAGGQVVEERPPWNVTCHPEDAEGIDESTTVSRAEWATALLALGVCRAAALESFDASAKDVKGAEATEETELSLSVLSEELHGMGGAPGVEELRAAVGTVKHGKATPLDLGVPAEEVDFEKDLAKKAGLDGLLFFLHVANLPLNEAAEHLGRAKLSELEHKVLAALSPEELTQSLEGVRAAPPTLSCLSSWQRARENCRREVQAIVDRCRGNEEKFTDESWNPFANEAFVMYVDKEKPGWDCTARKAECWKRAKEIRSKAILFSDGAATDDIQQGRCGDCYVLGALGGAVSNRRRFLRQAFVAYDEEVGVYGVLFCRDCHFTYEIVDDVLAVNKYGSFHYARSNTSRDEIWVSILEKAFFKHYTCVEMCDGGRGPEALYSFLGGIHGRYEIMGGDFKEPSKFFGKIQGSHQSGELLSTSFQKPSKGKYAVGGGEEGQCGEKGLPYGLHAGHCYSVLRTAEVDGHHLLCIRNPWARGEWKGPWSDQSEEWTDERRALVGAKKKEDGTFWMAVEDFVQVASSIKFSRTFGPAWQCAAQYGRFDQTRPIVRAKREYQNADDQEISLSKGDKVEILQNHGYWTEVKNLCTGKVGYVRSKDLETPTAKVDKYVLEATDMAENVPLILSMQRENQKLAREWNHPKGRSVTYKDTKYSSAYVIIYDKDGKQTAKLRFRDRHVFQYLEPAKGPFEVYVNSPDGRGKRFALYSFAPHGVLSLEKKECSYSEFLDKIG